MPAKNDTQLISKLVNALMDETVTGDIYERLADWFASTASEEEKLAALENYMYENLKPNDNLTKASTLKRFEELAARLGIAVPVVAPIAVLPARRPILRSVLLRAAAVLLPAMMIVGGYLLFDNARTPEGIEFTAEHTISVPATGSRHIVLPDGTEVTLNCGSELTYDDNRLCCLRGEGYFKVAKSQTPFVVHTNNLDVTVLGTEFNLRVYPGDELSTIALYSGSVEIGYEGGSHRLTPGTEFSYNNITREISMKPVDAAAGPEWAAAQGVSQLLTLGEIFRMIEQGYGVNIENKHIADTTLHYAFRLTGDPLETVMISLKIASGDFDYITEGNTIKLEPVNK